MRRAVIATVGTVVGLVALLDYKSSGAIGRSHVSVNAGPPAVAPSTTAPATPTGATSGTSPATTTPAGSSGQYTGSDVSYRYGDIEVQITVANGRITNISIPQESASDPRSQFINGQAIPILTNEALAAQNLNFDAVSGATFTSDAFAQSLQTALTKAGK
jgi:uncharacterized protein with FMN-binding domain